MDALLVTKPASGFVAGAVASTDQEEEQKKKEKEKKKKKEVISNEISYLIKRDVWRYLILWEFGGTVIDIDVLNSIIESDSSNLIKAAQDWFFGGGDNDGDAFVTMMDGTVLDGTVMQQNRIAVTSVMGASRPHHPLLYFSAKWALRTLTDDNYLVWGEANEFVSKALYLFVCLLLLLLLWRKSNKTPLQLSNLQALFFHQSSFFSSNSSEHSIPWVAIQTWQHYMQV